eukprot:g41238.t1
MFAYLGGVLAVPLHGLAYELLDGQGPVSTRDDNPGTAELYRHLHDGAGGRGGRRLRRPASCSATEWRGDHIVSNENSRLDWVSHLKGVSGALESDEGGSKLAGVIIYAIAREGAREEFRVEEEWTKVSRREQSLWKSDKGGEENMCLMAFQW